MGFFETANVFKYSGEKSPETVVIGDDFADFLGPRVDDLATEFAAKFPGANKYQLLNAIKFVAGSLPLDLRESEPAGD